MKFMFSLLAVLVMLVSCSQTQKCDIQDKLVLGMSNAVVKNLQCSNLDAIKADIDKVVGKIGLCKAQTAGQQSPIGDLCALIVDPIVDLAVGQAIPVAWGCTGGSTKDALKVYLKEACQQL